MREHSAGVAGPVRSAAIARLAASLLVVLVVLVVLTGSASPDAIGAPAVTAAVRAEATALDDVLTQGWVDRSSAFTPPVAGTVSAVRFWVAGSDVRAIATLRGADGTLIATATPEATTTPAPTVVAGSVPQAANGWRTLMFANPVTVAAGEVYRVTVTQSRGSVPAAVAESLRGPMRSLVTVPGGPASSAEHPWRSLWLRVEVDFTAAPVVVPEPTTSPTVAPTPTAHATRTPSAASGAGSTSGSGASGGSPAGGSAPTGWPTEATTGVPAGTVLTPSGSITVTDAGAVIDGLLVNGSITVRANNVTIKNTKVVGGLIDNGSGESSGTLIQDVEIDGAGVDGYSDGVSYSGFTVLRANIHHVGRGIHADHDVVVQDSYIHDLVVTGNPAAGGSHNEAFLSNGGTNLTVTHNRLTAGTQPNMSSSLSLYGDFDPISNVLVQGNLFNGGGYCVYAGSVTGKPYPVATTTRFVNNTFGRSVSQSCGAYGPVTSYSSGGGNAWTGNVWIDGGTVAP